MSSPLKNATLRQLATFHALARLGSVSRTAEEMHLTQPAVSIQLGILEQSAGTPLLQRSARGVKLTEAGDLLAGYAERMLDLWREAGEAMSVHCGDIAGLLRVGAVTTAEYLLPPLLLEFVREHPQVKVKLQVGNRAEIVRRLAGQDIDLAIMGRPPIELKTVSAAFAKHPMAFIAAPSHLLMAARELNLQAINRANLLVRERGSGTRTAVEQMFKDAGLTLEFGSEMSSNEAIKQMCASGFGVAFLSLHACALELGTGLLAILPMKGNPVQRDWYVMHLSSRSLPAAAAVFEQFLRARGQALIHRRLDQIPRHGGLSATVKAPPPEVLAEPACAPAPRARKKAAPGAG